MDPFFSRSRYSIGWRAIGVAIALAPFAAAGNYVWQYWQQTGFASRGVAGWLLLACYVVLLPPIASFVFQLFFSMRAQRNLDTARRDS